MACRGCHGVPLMHVTASPAGHGEDSICPLGSLNIDLWPNIRPPHTWCPSTLWTSCYTITGIQTSGPSSSCTLHPPSVDYLKYTCTLKWQCQCNDITYFLCSQLCQEIRINHKQTTNIKPDIQEAGKLLGCIVPTLRMASMKNQFFYTVTSHVQFN